jgi:hypothetical protein
MSPGKGTPIRPVRIAAGLWRAALLKAADEDTTVSEHIRTELERWTGYRDRDVEPSSEPHG